jgi:hypothetical protein
MENLRHKGDDRGVPNQLSSRVNAVVGIVLYQEQDRLVQGDNLISSREDGLRLKPRGDERGLFLLPGNVYGYEHVL